MQGPNEHSLYWGGEHNRCVVTDPRGEQILLSVPLQKHTDRICYMHKWQHQHWMAILSAYGKTPYFDYYRDYIEPIYRREWETQEQLNRHTAYVIDMLLHNRRPESDGTATTIWRHPRMLDLLFEYGPLAASETLKED